MKSTLLFILPSLVLGSCVSSGIPISVEGQTQSWRVAVTGNDPSGVTVSGGNLTIKHDYRAYLVSECDDPFTPTMFSTKLPLFGKTLAFTADLSRVSCACNAAFYLVSMPGLNSNQQPAPSQDGDYYCDANDVGGTWCPEIDLMEANNAAYQLTPHKCDAPTGNYYPACDKGGCGQNSYKTSPSAFGYGSQYTIDTSKPFRVAANFGTGAANSLTSISVTMTQGAKTFTMTRNDTTCKSGYVEALSTPVLQGMVPTFSLWGDSAQTMQWLDMPPCSASQTCDVTGTATFSNIAVY